MVRIENGVVLYTPYGEEERVIGNLADAEVLEGYLSLGGHGLPLERFPKLQAEWDKIPKKPVSEPLPSELTPTEQEVQKTQNEIDTINLLIELGVIPNVE